MSESLKILIVDDDMDVRGTIADVLADEGVDVAVAENGLVALEVLEGGLRPDVILLDMMMPEMDGWEFRAEQRKRPDLASIPVVVFTAHGISSDAADQLGAQGVLKKPFRFADLLQTVNRFRPSGGAATCARPAWRRCSPSP